MDLRPRKGPGLGGFGCPFAGEFHPRQTLAANLSESLLEARPVVMTDAIVETESPESDEIQGKAKGGFARAEVLTPEERKKIASNAAKARWGDNLPRTIREGKLSLLGRSIPCAVIEGEIRILNQAGFLRAIGRARSPKAGTGIQSTVDELPFFLQAKVLRPFITEDLAMSTKPIIYRVASGATETGYDALLLPRVADVYLKYRDDCLKNGGLVPEKYRHIIETCDILMRSLAGVAIVALVDEASGYQEIRPQNALQAYLEKLVAKELAAWAKKFPDEFYENIYKLKGLAGNEEEPLQRSRLLHDRSCL